MTDTNFVRDGRVGDKVHDIMLGNGVIKKLNPSMKYGVECDIEDERTSYTATGEAWQDGRRPRLRWGHQGAAFGLHPERFNYPLCMCHEKLIVEFTSLHLHTVLKTVEGYYPVGTECVESSAHTTDYWKPCERPVWKPTKPTWCYVGSGTKQLICKVNNQGQYVDIQCHYWTKAEPCAPEDIPDWWPKAWV